MVLLSPISAFTVSETTDTSTIPPTPTAPPATVTAVCNTRSRLSASTVTFRFAFASPSRRASTVFLKTWVSISKVTPTAPIPIPELILFNWLSDAASSSTDWFTPAPLLSAIVLMFVLSSTIARVVELATVVATTPATPTTPPATPTGAKFISS